MLINDFMLDKITSTPVTGCSFVYNVQLGLNTYDWLFGKKKKLTKYAAWEGHLANLGAAIKEKTEGYDFGEAVSHKMHALGLGVGLLFGLISKSW